MKFFRFVSNLRSQLVSYFFSALSVFLILTNNQLRDMIQVLAESWTTSVRPVVWAAVDLAIFSAAITTYGIFILRQGSRRQANGIDAKTASGFFLRWLPFLAGLAPGISLALRAASMETGQAPLIQTHLTKLAAISFAASLIGVAFSLFYTYATRAIFQRIFNVILFSSIGLWGMGIVGFSVSPYEWGAFWGPLAIFFAGMAFWLQMVVLAIWISRRKRLAIIPAFMIAYAIVQYFNLQQHRQVPLLARDVRDSVSLTQYKGKPNYRTTAAMDVRAWLESRPDFADYRKQKRPYPIILVSAEGGGIRAAALSSLVLATLDEQTNNTFSNHVYCMSGVSGGAVGLGFYRAILDYDKKYPGTEKRSDRLRRLLSRDFLSGPLGRLLFTDGPTGWIPFLSSRVFDRSDALGVAFRQAWRAETALWGHEDDALGQAMADYPINSGPNLLINSTSVDRQSPFAMTRLTLSPRNYSLANFDARADIMLGDAMCLSSRFPGVSSVGQLRWDARSDHFVDGGYYDNTGLESLTSIYRGILDATQFYDIGEVRIMVVRIGSDLSTAYLNAEKMKEPPPAAVDPLSPILSAANVYLSTVLNAETKLVQNVNASRFSYYWLHHPSFLSMCYQPLVLKYVNKEDKQDTLPLGWNISGRSVGIVYDLFQEKPERETDLALREANVKGIQRIRDWMTIPEWDETHPLQLDRGR